MNDGTASAPSYSWASDQDTGFYRYAEDSIGVAVAGDVILRVEATALKFGHQYTPEANWVGVVKIGPPTVDFSVDTRVRIMSSETPGVRAALTLENHVSTQPHHVTLAMGSQTTAELGERFGIGLSQSGIYGLVMEHGDANGAGLYDGHIGILVASTKARHPLTVGQSEPPVSSNAVIGAYASTSGSIMFRDTSANVEIAIGSAGAAGMIGTLTDQALLIYRNNAEVARFNSAGNLLVGTTTTVSGAGSVNIAGEFFIDAVRVLTNRKTGWSVATGTATRTAFDTATVTLPQLAERVKALIDDLHGTAGHGIIGT